MKTVERYFIRINEESVDSMINEYGSLESDGFETLEEALKDFEPCKKDHEGSSYEVVKITAEAVTMKVTLKERKV